MQQFNTIQLIAIWALPVLFAITVHETSHGWVASKLGDKTALMLGRLTLNPIKHIDLFGTIIVPIVLLTIGGFVFGWAKPVPVTYQNLKHPKRDMALVAAAGPLSNLLMAFIWGGFSKLGVMMGIVPLYLMGQAGILINLVLMVLNLIPIPPLDGSRVMSSLLPPKLSYQYDQLERFGFMIVLLLIIVGILGKILTPPVFFLKGLITGFFGI